MAHRSRLERQLPGLFSTPPVPMPYLAGAQLRSFVLDTDRGVLVVYNTPALDAAAGDIADLGNPRALLINHWHEKMYGTPDLDIPIFVHEKDRARSRPELRIDGTFRGRGMFGEDVEIIPSGGHTAGATLFLWDNGEHRFLFPGDSFWIDGDEWRAVILEESDSEAFLATLELMRELDFDVLVPWLAWQGERPYAVITPEEKQARIDALVGRIVRGDRGTSV